MKILIMVLLGQFWPIHLTPHATVYFTTSFAYDRNPFQYPDGAIDSMIDGYIQLPIKLIDDFRTSFLGTLRYSLSPSTAVGFRVNVVSYARNTEKGYQRFKLFLKSGNFNLDVSYLPYKLLFYTLKSGSPVGYHSARAGADYRIDVGSLCLKPGLATGMVKFENPTFDFMSGRFYQASLGLCRKTNCISASYKVHRGAESDAVFSGYVQRGVKLTINEGLSKKLKLEFSASYRNRYFVSSWEGYRRIDDIYSTSVALEYRYNLRLGIVPFAEFYARRIWRDFASPISVGKGMPYNRPLLGIKLRFRI